MRGRGSLERGPAGLRVVARDEFSPDIGGFSSCPHGPPPPRRAVRERDAPRKAPARTGATPPEPARTPRASR